METRLYTATRPAVGKTVTLVQYHDDGSTSSVTRKVTHAGTRAGWYDDNGTGRRYEWERPTPPTPDYEAFGRAVAALLGDPNDERNDAEFFEGVQDAAVRLINYGK